MTLSKESLLFLQTMFSKGSPLQLPVGVAEIVLEIRQAVDGEIAQSETGVRIGS